MPNNLQCIFCRSSNTELAILGATQNFRDFVHCNACGRNS